MFIRKSDKMINRCTIKCISLLLLSIILLIPANAADKNYQSVASLQVPILLYHRFGPTAADNMTVTTPVFVSHLEYLRTNGYSIIPLRQLVDYYLGKGLPPPPRSVVITADDGHKSVYTDMLPLVKKYRIPVTIFIYPSAISNASYAMTWDQIRELKKTGFFDIQSHTYWHPNFKKEHERLSSSAYEKFVDMQMRKSKAKLEKELDVKIDMLAWPFGINDDFLIKKAAEAGYVGTFTIEGHSADASDHVMKLPRYLLTNVSRGKAFEWIFANPTNQKMLLSKMTSGNKGKKE
ncbi:MAG TPA: polysaccharide deacetylase family protein [Syntrophales bacterium]|nr:polysaccharide deacetylase family protein [Syntrophales bacterium]